jgi:twinkle protein
MVIDELRRAGIEVRCGADGEQRVLCPMCSPFRRKARERCLAVNIDDERAVWHCWHCEWSGATGGRGLERKRSKTIGGDFGTASRRLRYGVFPGT